MGTSADRAGRRDFLGGPTVRRGLPQASLPCPRKRVPPFGTSGREGQPHRRLKSPAARCTRLGGISGGIGDNLPPSGTALRKPPARVFLEKHPTGMFFVSFLRLLMRKRPQGLCPRTPTAFEKAGKTFTCLAKTQARAFGLAALSKPRRLKAPFATRPVRSRTGHAPDALRISARLILPPMVLGSSSTYSMTRGYL